MRMLQTEDCDRPLIKRSTQMDDSKWRETSLIQTKDYFWLFPGTYRAIQQHCPMAGGQGFRKDCFGNTP